MSYTLKCTLASAPKTVRGKPTALKGDPRGKKFLYTNGTSVFIRSLENPSDCDVYTEHSKETTVACYAPSGNYIASGDLGGKLRIWDTLGAEHMLKYEYQVLGGAIKDIAWTEDSKRIVVGGEGREKFAHAIMWDTGTSVGNLAGQAKPINNVDIKQNRPYRAVTASEDYTVSFFEGPPFKYKDQIKSHTNFVNCVRYAPDGSKYATGGADGKSFICDGKTGELLFELNKGEGRIHKGGVYGISWSSDSKELLTVSADKTAKIWDVDNNKLAVEFKFPDKLENQQLGCLWCGDHIVTVSLNGNLNFLDRTDPSKPSKVVQGHNKGIMAIAASEDKASLFSASYDGLVFHWNVKSGLAEKVEGQTHSNQINTLSLTGNHLVSCGMDDTVRFINVPTKQFIDEVLGMSSQPQSVAAGKDGFAVVACLAEVVVIRSGKVVHKLTVGYEPSAIAIDCTEARVAVGSRTDGISSIPIYIETVILVPATAHPREFRGLNLNWLNYFCRFKPSKENSIYVYDLENDVLKQNTTLTANGNVTCLSFSTDGALLASGDNGKCVKVFDASTLKEKFSKVYHAAKVNSVAFTPDSRYIASCSVDSFVNILNADNGVVDQKIKAAHGLGVNITQILWLNDNTLVTAGQQDCSLRIWEIKHGS